MHGLGDSELLQLIGTEIDLGFTFLRTYHLAAGDAHKNQALQNANAAWRTATSLLSRLTDEEADVFRPSLQDLESAIEARQTSG